MGGGLESRWVGRVYGFEGAARHYIVASSWYFTLLRDEDARSNNPQNSVTIVSPYDRLQTLGSKILLQRCKQMTIR